MLLSERRHPPNTYFQPITETISKPFTMSTSASAAQEKIRIYQQPSGSVRVGQRFDRPLIMESDTADKLVFTAYLTDLNRVVVPSGDAQLHGMASINGDEGVHSKRKRSSSSTAGDVEHATFSDISVPSKGRFTITVHANKMIDNTYECMAILTTDPFDVV